MIIFEDLPSTNTPINASNLNNNFEELSDRDYVVESGTSGIWAYRKWNSGIAECWCAYESEPIPLSSWGQWGNVYSRDNAIPRINFPFSFIEQPITQCTPMTVNGNYWIYTNGHGFTDRTPNWGVARGTAMSYDLTVKANLYAIGKWK